jgi:hypothetical protein
LSRREFNLYPRTDEVDVFADSPQLVKRVSDFHWHKIAKRQENEHPFDTGSDEEDRQPLKALNLGMTEKVKYTGRSGTSSKLLLF